MQCPTQSLSVLKSFRVKEESRAGQSAREQTALRAAARVQAFDRVLSTELYELIADDTDF